MRDGAGAPAIEPVDAALQAYAGEVAAVRRDGLIRGLPGDVAERFFALGFSLEQMRQNLRSRPLPLPNWCEAAAEKLADAKA